jgi:hypothetical protein
MKVRLPEFDVLVDMARNDPQGLETLRRSLTNAVITTASTEAARRRLHGLQFRIDMERRRASTPLAAAVRLSNMMCESLARLRQSLVAPDLLLHDPVRQQPSASVTRLPFDRRLPDAAPAMPVCPTSASDL